MAATLKITSRLSHPLFDAAATRSLENQAQAFLPTHSLMQRAGLAAAQLSLALAPHARHIWVACGPGNNGGDGFETALQLQRLGKKVSVTWSAHGHDHDEARQPADARASRLRVQEAGLALSPEPPEFFDFAVDALLGLGGMASLQRPASLQMTHWLDDMRTSGAPTLALDLPTGLDADTGAMSPTETNETFELLGHENQHSNNRHTLSLLTLKPGLFTAAGRDQAGQVWFNDLGVNVPPAMTATAWLLGADRVLHQPRWQVPHASHKGSFGDVAVLGGQAGQPGQANMAGAALLAARAALHAGAGRVFVALLGCAVTLDPVQPELMFREPGALDLTRQVVVCGCGGGTAVREYMPTVLTQARHLVLDADALNAIATDPLLQTGLKARQERGQATILTPHPLEAARLLKWSAAEVQSDRCRAARQLAERFGCVVVLKGSGSVLAAPGKTPLINHSGNALLATAGTGDVLAGMIGAALASGQSPWAAASSAVFRHGQAADDWAKARRSSRPGAPNPTSQALQTLTASELVKRQSL